MANRVLIIVDVDVVTGEYEVTFKNKSNPGFPMELGEIKRAFAKVAESFASEEPKESGPKQVLA